MTVLLLSLPLGNLATPPLSLASLTAYLREHGVETHQRDLGVELVTERLGRETVQAAFEDVAERVQALDQRPDLTPSEAIRLTQLIEIDMAAAYVTDRIDGALAYLREQEPCIDHRRVADTLRTVDWAFLASHPGTAPLRLSRNDLSLGLGFLQRHRGVDDPFWQGLGLVQRMTQRIDALMAAHRPHVVGLSMAFRSQVAMTLLAAELVKRADPSCHVVLGGPMVAHLGDTLIWDLDAFRDADTLVVQEGETALLALVRALERSESPDGIQNTIRRRGDELVRGPVHSGASGGIRLGGLPTPVFDGLALDAYLTKVSTLPLLSSRGCYYRKCTFCAHHEVYGGAYAARSAESVVGDMRALVQAHAVRSFYFCDECMSPGFARRFSERLLAEELDVGWVTEIRFGEKLTDDLIRQMAAAGCRYLLFGLESACPRVREAMGKGGAMDDVRRALRTCHESGIRTHCFVIAGFPTETAQELEETFDFLAEFAEVIDSVSISQFLLEEGTPIWHHPERYDIHNIRPGPGGRLLYDQRRGAPQATVARMVADFLHRDPRVHFPVARIDRTNFPWLDDSPDAQLAEDSLFFFPTRLQRPRGPDRLVCRRSPRFGTGRYHHDIVGIRKGLATLPPRLAQRITDQLPIRESELEGLKLPPGWAAAGRSDEPHLIGANFGAHDCFRLGGGLEHLLPDVDRCESMEELERAWSALGLESGEQAITAGALIGMLAQIRYFDTQRR